MTNELANLTMAPTMEHPKHVPDPPAWVEKPLADVTVYDITPENYYSRAWLKQFLSDNGQAALVLTTRHLSTEWVENPERPDDADWKDVLHFDETTTKLVLNKSRKLMMADQFGMMVSDWLGQRVALSVGESEYAEGHVQICVHAVGNVVAGEDDEVNDVLFG